MKKISALMGGVAITLLFSFSSIAVAQNTQAAPKQQSAPAMGSGSGSGPGAGMGMGPGGGMGAGMGGGMGPGGGRGMGGKFNFDNSNTRGWTLMTPEEQAAHRQSMMSAKSVEACREIQAKHYAEMTERAQAQGKTLAAPRQNACDRMQARGFFQ